jgi:hypothetical protein
MTTDTKINLCYPCGFFRPGDAEDPIAGDFQNIDGAVWPKTAQVFWEKLRDLKDEEVCTFSGGTLTEGGSIQIASLSENWRIDTKDEKVIKSHQENADTWDEWDRQLPFLVLVYLVSAQNHPVSYDMVLPRDLYKGFDLFRNGLDMDIRRIEKTFGHDGEGFLNAALRLGGDRIKGGDVGVRFHIFPKFPVDYILWLGDSEFPANLTILVDRSTPDHFSGDAIGVALNLLSRRLCREAPAAPSAG